MIAMFYDVLVFVFMVFATPWLIGVLLAVIGACCMIPKKRPRVTAALVLGVLAMLFGLLSGLFLAVMGCPAVMGCRILASQYVPVAIVLVLGQILAGLAVVIKAASRWSVRKRKVW
jgi:hypothetical protein